MRLRFVGPIGPTSAVWFICAVLTLLAGCGSIPVSGPVSVPSKPEVTGSSASASVPASPATSSPTLALPVKKPLSIGLALGSGAARGFAHVGVIQVLEEAGIKPSLVVGTSAGSLVAALYASGKSGVQLQQLAESMEEATFADWTLPIFNRGILRGDALARYVSTQVGGKAIEDLPLPLGIVATDLNNGQGVLFRRGDTAMAVRASSAVPAVFHPVRILGRDYVDGGLVSPVPVQFARQMGADLVLAVDISTPPEGNSASDTLQILMQTFTIMGRSINQWEVKDADLLIKPVLVGVGSADFGARRRAIQAGRLAMQQAMPQLRALMK